MNNSHTYLEIFGNNIRHFRLSFSLSQEELAAKAGLHRTYIGSVERGERNVTLKNIIAIAKALDIQIYQLVEGIQTSSDNL